MIVNVIKYPLTHIINLSLRTGYIHPRLKEAKVIPLFKSGDKDLFTNHHPISLLNAISKLLEKVPHHQLCNFSVLFRFDLYWEGIFLFSNNLFSFSHFSGLIFFSLSFLFFYFSYAWEKIKQFKNKGLKIRLFQHRKSA